MGIFSIQFRFLADYHFVHKTDGIPGGDTVAAVQQRCGCGEMLTNAGFCLGQKINSYIHTLRIILAIQITNIDVRSWKPMGFEHTSFR